MLHVLVAVLDPAADAQAVGVVRALRAAVPSLDVSRLGGLALAREQVRDIASAGSLDAGLQRTPIDAALLVGGGTLRQARLARHLRKHDVTVAALRDADDVQWTWGDRRLAAACDVVIASPIDDVAGLAEAGRPVRYVGHWLADEVTLPLAADRAEARRALGLTEEHPVVAVSAGAGPGALRALAAPLTAAIQSLQGAERLQVAIAVADDATAPAARRLFGRASGVTVHAATPRMVCTAADVTICGDGETTLLAALLGTPMLLVQRRTRQERFVRWVAPRLGGRVAMFSAWPNRVLAEAVVPELVDAACEPARIASAVTALVADAAEQARRLAEVRKAVRADRAWAATASMLLDMALGHQGASTDQPPTVKRSS